MCLFIAVFQWSSPPHCNLRKITVSESHFPRFYGLATLPKTGATASQRQLRLRDVKSWDFRAESQSFCIIHHIWQGHALLVAAFYIQIWWLHGDEPF